MKRYFLKYGYITACCLLSIALTSTSFANPSFIAQTDSLNKLARKYLSINYPQAAQYASQAAGLATPHHYHKGYITALCLQATAQVNMNACKEALRSLQTISPAILKEADPSTEAQIFATLGSGYYYYGRYDSADFFYRKALQGFKENTVEYAYTALKVARLYLKNGSSHKASEYRQKAFRIFSEKNDPTGCAWAEVELEELYYTQRLYEKALGTLKKNYKLFQQQGDISGMASVLLFQGNNYYMLIRDDSARTCWEQACRKFSQLGDSNGVAICYSNLSRVYLEGGKTDDALAYVHKALHTISTDNYPTITAGTYQQLGDIYGELGQYEKAVGYVQKALAAARVIGNKTIIKDCYKSLSELYEAMKQPDLAMKSLLAAYRLKDSIQPLEFSRQLADMQAAYESEKKESQIQLLKHRQQISTLKMQKQETALQKQRTLLLLSLLVILAIVSAVYFYVTRLRLLEKIKRQKIVQEAEERERMRIAKDIHDELGSGLSKIKFLTEFLKHPHQQTGQMQKTLQSISETAVSLIDNMRDLVWTMNPANTTLDNLLARMREYSADYLEELPIELHVDLPPQIPDKKIAKETGRNIQMILKEALQNIVKHAGATKVFVIITLEPQFNMVIEDNGDGYNEPQQTQGNGLRNMQMRSDTIGGVLKISSSPGKGTRIELSVTL